MLFDEVDGHLRSCIERQIFPGAQYVVGEGGALVAEGAIGSAVLGSEMEGAEKGESLAVTPQTIYDLASLTKPLVTALLVAIFAERGVLNLSAPLGDSLREFSAENQRDITLTALLTHTSGLAAWRPLYLEAPGREDVAAAIARLPRQAGANSEVIYSDLNYILLGFALERLVGERLDRLARREIFAPLALERTMFNPPPWLRREIAATERGQAYERSTVARMAFACPLPEAGAGERSNQPLRRKGLIWGEVHDGNAYFLGGVAGHAGLFSTAREVFRIADQFLPGSQLLKGESLARFTKNFTTTPPPGRGEARSLGWMLAATADCSAGPALRPEAFGHTGFTGTSVWVEPPHRRVFVLLTNRVHPEVRDVAMKAARQTFHGLAVEALKRR